MIWVKLYNGWYCKFKNNSQISFMFHPRVWALPLRIEWINCGKGFTKALGIEVLCFEVEYDNGKPPF